MAQVILDMGSGNTCQNDSKIIEEMIDTVIDIDSGVHDVIFKWQLFNQEAPNRPLLFGSFVYAYHCASSRQYQTTASIFDMGSLRLLISCKDEMPFIKIPCRPDLYWLIGEIPRKYLVYFSIPEERYMTNDYENCFSLSCIPKYPATLEEYEKTFATLYHVSDHTPGLELFYKHEPEIWEKHFILKRDKDNPDSGPFAITPEELKEIL